MSDLISRQAAIDALKGLPTWWADAGGYYGDAQPPMTALLDPEDAISAIENLPSAQPDVIRCKNCRFQDKGSNESESWNLCGYRPWLHVPTEDEHYCGYAERRTDE